MLIQTIKNIRPPFRWGPRFVWQKYFSTKEDRHIDVIKEYLNINDSLANYLVLKYPTMKKLNEAKMQELMNTMYSLGFTKKDIIKEPSLFGMQPITLKFRYKTLNECGIENISIEDLMSYLALVKKKTVGELKSVGKMQKHINIENRLAGYMTQWPTSLTTLILGDVNNLNLYTIRLKIIQRYLELVLDLTEEEFYRGIETYPTIKHRPLRIINEVLQMLMSQIMIPNNKIKTNLYLVHTDPKNLSNVINNFRSIGGIDIKEIIRLHPKIATKRYETLLEIRNILEEYGISSEAQMKCFDLYTLSPTTIKERLEKSKAIPEFNTYFHHPRFLKVIHHHTKAAKRLSQLYNKNKKCLSLNILFGSSNRYDLFQKAPGDKLGKGKDLIFCIEQSLDRKFSAKNIRNILQRHPFWINIPLVRVQFVYQKLSVHFSEEDIYENCIVLLYPWDKIKGILNIFAKKTYISSLLNEAVAVNKLSNSQKLSLVLYMLEQRHYFTGNGVWSDEATKQIDLQEPTVNKMYSLN